MSAIVTDFVVPSPNVIVNVSLPSVVISFLRIKDFEVTFPTSKLPDIVALPESKSFAVIPVTVYETNVPLSGGLVTPNVTISVSPSFIASFVALVVNEYAGVKLVSTTVISTVLVEPILSCELSVTVNVSLPSVK